MNPDSVNQCPDKKYLPCECVNNVRLNSEIVSLDFLWDGPVPQSGQFFLVKLPGTSVFLGRPLSVAQYDAAGRIVKFIFAVRGAGTMELAETKPGEKAWLTGPLGRSWLDVSGNDLTGKIALVSGGVGAAPLAFLVNETQTPGFSSRVNFDFYAGFRSRSFGLEGVTPRSLVISSEDGSEGHKGRITDFLVPGAYNAVFACGPEPMLKAVAAKCAAADVPCYVSLERRMACGVGACLGCTVSTKSGNKRCCADGPVFNAGEVYFER